MDGLAAVRVMTPRAWVVVASFLIAGFVGMCLTVRWAKRRGPGKPIGCVCWSYVGSFGGMVGAVGMLAQAYPWGFLCIWALLPCLAFALNRRMISSLFTLKGLKVFRVILVASAIFLSVGIHNDQNWYRDNIASWWGKACLVSYTRDLWGSGSESSHVYCDSWVLEAILNSLGGILIVASILNVALTFAGTYKAVESRESGRLRTETEAGPMDGP